jgi:hypothetical protein
MKTIEYVDLGLPSGTLWASHNAHIGKKYHFTYTEAIKNFSEQMPTTNQFQELIDNCKWQWTELFGGKINGYRITGPNGNSIFLPASGYSYNALLYGNSFFGYYWSSKSYYRSYARYLHFRSESKYITTCTRFYGHSIRTVKIKHLVAVM